MNVKQVQFEKETLSKWILTGSRLCSIVVLVLAY